MTTSSQTDVIIIGAGVSGLSAAKELTKHGLSFVVVEASHRIGGRVYSVEIAPGVWFDLGCAYLVTNKDPALIHPFVTVAKALGIEIGEDKVEIYNNLQYFHNGKKLGDAEEAALSQYLKDNHAAIVESVNRGEDRAIVELIDLDNPYVELYNNNVSGSSTGDVDQMSAADYFNANSDQEIAVLNGYGNLVREWGADVPVSLNTKVETVDWSEDHVRVDTAKGTLRGRCVLTTVSTGVLAARHIRFKPELPGWKIDAINGLPTGTENKIGVHFDKDIFGPDGRGAYYSWRNRDVGAEIEASVMGLNVAIVFTSGRHAVWLEEQGQRAGHDFAVNRIADVFGNDIRKSVTHSIVSAWTRDPCTLGAYSHALPGQSHQREELARSIDDKVFFAGEATLKHLWGNAHGAHESGICAAQEISNTLQRSNSRIS